MAFRLAPAPAVQRRAWLAALAFALVTLALVAAAVSLWHPGGATPAAAAAALRASALFNSGQVQPDQQPADAAPQLPPLCGGTSGVRRVADSLAASGQALMESLQDAFQPYEQGFSLEDLEATAAQLKSDSQNSHVVNWIEVHNKTITFPRRKNQECLENCDAWYPLLKDRLERGMREGRLTIPEGLPFLLNVDDYSACHVEGDGSSRCKAPLFSIFKSKFDRDVLIPNFKPEVFEPVFHPWESKKEIAFFRGAPICSNPSLNGTRPGTTHNSNCSRWVVAQLSWDHPEILNATLSENVTQYGGPLWVDMPRVSHQAAAEYKYLLAVDGSTAAYRLAFLMATNSVVLKQVTDKVEWYYKAVHRCEHYLPFWVHNETDVLQLVLQLQGNHENDLVAQHIAANSQAFALTYLSPEYAYWYWQLMMDKYAALYRGPRSGGSSAGGGSPAGGGSSSSSGSNSSPAEGGNSGSSPADGGSIGKRNAGSAATGSSLLPPEPVEGS